LCLTNRKDLSQLNKFEYTAYSKLAAAKILNISIIYRFTYYVASNIFCGQISNISHKMTTTHKIGNGGTGPVTSNIDGNRSVFEVTGPNNIEYGKFIAKFDIWVLFWHRISIFRVN
jgi:hypothetical protein